MSPKDKRSLTQARSGAPVSRGGAPEAAAGLARALDVGAVSEESARRLTHGFHAYAAKMHPLTARRALGLVAGAGASVLDPFCGSGTVLVEAMRRGARAIGVDASPLAVLIARAKVAPLPARFVERARRIAALVVQEGKAARRAGYQPPPPRPASQALREWFAPHVLRELEALAREIAAEPDETLAAPFTAVLSSILVKMAKREPDGAGAAAERKLARGMAARLFAARAEELATGMDALARDTPRGTPAPRVELGDARRLTLAGGSVDAIVTSPPYAGTYDYLEQHALRLAFLGLAGEARFQEREMGARRGFKDVGRGLAAWERDLGQALGEMRRVLKKGGRAVLLVGDSLAGAGRAAQAVLADETTTRLAQAAGLARVAWASQRRQPLGALERTAFARREKREHLILLEAT